MFSGGRLSPVTRDSLQYLPCFLFFVFPDLAGPRYKVFNEAAFHQCRACGGLAWSSQGIHLKCKFSLDKAWGVLTSLSKSRPFILSPSWEPVRAMELMFQWTFAFRLCSVAVWNILFVLLLRSYTGCIHTHLKLRHLALTVKGLVWIVLFHFPLSSWQFVLHVCAGLRTTGDRTVSEVF